MQTENQSMLENFLWRIMFVYEVFLCVCCNKQNLATNKAPNLHKSVRIIGVSAPSPSQTVLFVPYWSAAVVSHASHDIERFPSSSLGVSSFVLSLRSPLGLYFPTPLFPSIGHRGLSRVQHQAQSVVGTVDRRALFIGLHMSIGSRRVAAVRFRVQHPCVKSRASSSANSK